MRRKNTIILKKSIEPARNRNNGFSLIELMVAVALVAVLSAIIVPSFFTYRTNYQLKAAARDVYSAMQKAKVNAAKESTPWVVIFDDTANSYQLCGESGDGLWTTAADNVCESVVNLSLYNVEFGRTGANKAPNDDVGTSVTYTNNTAGFNPTGSAFESDGTAIGTPRYVYLRNDSSILYAVGTTRAGIIRFYVWTGGAWK